MPAPARRALTLCAVCLTAAGLALPAAASAGERHAGAASRHADRASGHRARLRHATAVRGRGRHRHPAPPRLTAAGWSAPEQRQVLAAGVLTLPAPASVAWGRPLTAAELRGALDALGARVDVQSQQPSPSQPSAPSPSPSAAAPTVVSFDAALVVQLGLGDIAEHVQQVAVGAGLRPPAYFGSEVVARYLGLRHMQPTAAEALEPYPTDPITRAEAAFSFARVLGLSSWAVEDARSTLGAFELPTYDAAQRTVLALAVSKIGMPYVWGGTTDDTSDGLPHGGYDCSGFAWRVYKVSGLPWGRQIQGRTAAQQAGEIPRSQRLRLADVRGGDLLFFGSAHFDARATEASIIHEGIALSSQWAIHSSGEGVAVEPLEGSWLGQSFAWARRVL